jgi:hypothetical protein
MPTLLVRRPALFALGAVCLLACGGGGRGAPESTIVRPRAVYELSCPDAELIVTRISGSTYGVSGCGARATYNCMGGMGQYACTREGDVEGRTTPPTIPADAEDVTASGQPVSTEVLPRSRASLQCDDVHVYEIARLTYAAEGCGNSVVFGCMGSMGNYRCEQQ